MYRDDRIAGSWEALRDRLETSGAISRWARREPVLASLDGVDALLSAMDDGADADRSDQILGALVRLASTDGGGEEDAVLLILHLLSPGVHAMAARYHGLSPDLTATIVSELAARIVSYPWRRRRRAVAANLLLDTRSAILRELCPRRARGSKSGEDIPVDPDGALWRAPEGDVSYFGPNDDVDLHDLLAWAAHKGVARSEDLELLLELARNQGQVSAPRLHAASARGINERTVRRRRDRALQALRQARQQYLSDVA
jgi:hypothetical protein